MKNKILNRCISIERCIGVLILLFILQFVQIQASNATSNSTISTQRMNISLSVKEMSIGEVFKKIEANSDYIIIYDPQIIDVSKKVTIDVSNSNIEDVLDDLFKQTSIDYQIHGRQVVLKTNEKKEPAKATQDGNTVRGTILDESGQALIGVIVQVKETQQAAVSDINGYYIIKVEPGQTLVFSYLGFLEEKVLIQKQKSLNIVMKEDIKELDEIVVVGMGEQRKASVIGSISTIKVAELDSPQRSLTSSLSGRIAGATIVQRTGEPGQDDASFWIRGISTFGNNKEPLILVDGVERAMSDLVTEEIESFSILKDASATAVYGVRAANGVVLITTRKGIAQRTPTIEVKLEAGTAEFTRMPKYLDGANYARLFNEAAGKVQYTKDYIQKLQTNENPYLYPNVDWFDEVFKKRGSNSSASLSIRGGGDVARYFVNATYFGETGMLRDNPETAYGTNINLERYNFRTNVDLTLTKSTNLSIEIGANLTDLHAPSSHYGEGTSNMTAAQAIFYHANKTSPISNPVRLPIGEDQDGNILYGWGAPTIIGATNPVEVLMGRGYTTQFTSRIMSQIVLNQQLDFVTEGLKFVGSFSFDTDNTSRLRRARTSSTYSVREVDEETGELIVEEVSKGIENLLYSKELQNTRAKEFKAQLLYDKVINGTHRLAGMGMYYQRDYINAAANTSILGLPYRKQGIALRATYSYDDRYFAEFNVGYNGSENFPKHNRFGWFPAGALGYLISNESFWKVKFINSLKLRGSIGLVGAEALAAGRRYGYLSTYGTGLGNYNWGQTITEVAGVGENAIGVSNLTWEKGLKKNVGFEMKMLNSAISLDVDIFHEKRTDILVERTSIPYIAGLNTMPYANIGEMTNKGIEITSEYADKFGDFSYRIYGNFSFTRNKIIEKDEAPKKYPYRMETGQRYGQRFGLIALGLFESQEDIDASPEQKFGAVRPGDVKYLDLNGDGFVDQEDQTAIGYSNIPEIIYGFGVQFNYKGFDLGVFFRGQANVTYDLGGTAFIPFSEGVGKNNLYVEALDRWTEDNPNPDAFYPRLSDGKSTNNWQKSSRNIYDGSLLRLADVELGYTFKQKWLSKVGVKGLRVYMLGNNLAIFSKWKMWDPETGSQNGATYPNTRKYNLGLKVTF